MAIAVDLGRKATKQTKNKQVSNEYACKSTIVQINVDAMLIHLSVNQKDINPYMSKITFRSKCLACYSL